MESDGHRTRGLNPQGPNTRRPGKRSRGFTLVEIMVTLSVACMLLLSIALIAEGQTNKEVASGLGLAEKTVKNYLSNIFEKLHVSRRSQAAAMFVRESR